VPTLTASRSAGDAVLTSLKSVQWDAEDRLVSIAQLSRATEYLCDLGSHSKASTYCVSRKNQAPDGPLKGAIRAGEEHN
jgi:hypothetical protein